MTVIQTKPALPVRAWHWTVNTLGAFWCGSGGLRDFVRGELRAIRRLLP